MNFQESTPAQFLKGFPENAIEESKLVKKTEDDVPTLVLSQYVCYEKSRLVVAFDRPERPIEHGKEIFLAGRVDGRFIRDAGPIKNWYLDAIR